MSGKSQYTDTNTHGDTMGTGHELNPLWLPWLHAKTCTWCVGPSCPEVDCVVASLACREGVQNPLLVPFWVPALYD